MSNDEAIWNNEDWRKLLEVILVIFALMIIAGFGEEANMCLATTDKNLEYYETNFTTNEWFNVLQNVTLNITTNKLYLNLMNNEYNYNIDCTTFTKVGTHKTITIPQVRHQYDSYNDADWVYYDFGANFFTCDKHLEVNYTLLNSDNNPYRWSVPIALGNSLNGWNTDANRQILVRTHWGNVEYDVYLNVGEMNNHAWSNWASTCVTTTLTRDANYYCTFYINSTHVVNEVFSDSTRTNRIRYLYMVLTNDDYSYRYLFIARSAVLGVETDTVCDSYSLNYEIRYYISGCAVKGYAYTKNLLENATNIAFSSLVNATLGANTNLKIYFSSDNVTWGDERLYLTSTGIDYTRLENLNYISLYAKFELNSNGLNNVEVLNFFYTNILDITVTASNNDWFMLLFFIGVPSIIVLGIVLSKRRGF